MVIIGGVYVLSRPEFIRISLEINLFFQRIMKEHLFFIETNLQPVAHDSMMEARTLKQGFEELLARTVYYANGIISEDSIQSNEFVTPYTLQAEEISSKLTGASIDTKITQAELGLTSNPTYNYAGWFDIACYINLKSFKLLERVIAFQKGLLDMALECKIFITLYDEMLRHDTREAEHYLEILKSLQEGKLPRKTLCDELDFWNNIMEEHAQFVDGMLDPSEKYLKDAAKDTAEIFEDLVKRCITAAENKIVQESLNAAEDIKHYKKTITEGLLKCEIESIIPPLLADHVLREANHYLRLLKMINK